MFYDFLKRIVDIAGSLIALIVLSPLMIMVVAGIELMSEGPIFYTPERVGKGGRLFKMLKFRSMKMYRIRGKIVHAEKYLLKNPKLLALYKKGSFKLTDDPRITPGDKIIRKFSLDELPQLINILYGDMSLVGPRAYQKDELDHQQKIYPHTRSYVKIILRARPGASGPWQVSGRSQINFDRRVEMDANYFKRRSIIYDLWIIIKIPFAMISGEGAI